MELRAEIRQAMGRPVLPKHIAQAEAAKAARMADLAAVVVPKPCKQMVYFIGAGKNGPVKIGIATDPVGRLYALQVSHYEKLTILATCVGGGEVERQYHRRFASARLHGEWFTRTPELEAEIARLVERSEAA